MKAPPETEAPPRVTGTARITDRLAGKSFDEDNLSRAGAQRRLAARIAASAGLSIAVAAVLVVVALGEPAT